MACSPSLTCTAPKPMNPPSFAASAAACAAMTNPTAKRLGLFGCCLLGDDRVDGTQFLEDLTASGSCTRRLEVPRRVPFLLDHGLDIEGHRSEQSSWLGGTVAARSVAIISFEISIGPPGSAIVMAIPATIGARSTRSHSSSVNDASMSCIPPIAQRVSLLVTRGGHVSDRRLAPFGVVHLPSAEGPTTVQERNRVPKTPDESYRRTVKG